MKTIKLAKRWHDRIDDKTVHEYPADASLQVTNEVAARAVAAGVLAGAPTDVRAARPARSKASTKPTTRKASAPSTPAADAIETP